jgi:hypothetical protein
MLISPEKREWLAGGHAGGWLDCQKVEKLSRIWRPRDGKSKHLQRAAVMEDQQQF